MRRAWLLVLACVLTAALAWLAVLQTRWIDKVSEAEGEAARRAMNVAARQFVEEVARELAGAALSFQGATPEPASLVRRLQEWAGSARDPRLIHAVYVADEAGALRRLEGMWNGFSPGPPPGGRPSAAADGLRTRPTLVPALRPPLEGTLTAIVVQLREGGVLIAELDRDYLVRRFFPEIARRNAEFDMAVVERGAIIWRSRPDWPRFSDDGVELSMPLAMMRRRSRESEPAREEMLPRLLIRRHGAPIKEAVAASRRNNLAVSFAILGLLGGSFVLLAVLARRAERLRVQQLEFVAGITHELNTPLAALTAAGENMVDGIVTDKPQIARYGEAIVKESRRLTDLVAQVLEFAGLQSSRRKQRAEAVDVARVIDDAIGACRWLADERGVNIEPDVAADLPSVEGDAAALRSAVQNLVANAVRHGGDGKWVGVHASRAGEQVVVRVEDRGPGIGARDLPHLFEPFYRGRNAARGSGLGLAIVKRVAAAHGGTIDVERRRERGVAFVLRLPAGLQHA